ncbi:MAG: T9SS type A sorting domain-containing protein [Bacteroidetes bacterium]|nr:T9SS type A sorting domain-containing protein [Bacteroidota bacterium]
MKKIYLLILFSFLFGRVYSQNWKPVNPQFAYHYFMDKDSLRQVFTLHVDSVKFVSGDSVYYFNRMMGGCDTCTSDTFSVLGKQYSFSKQSAFIYNKPLFLQREMNFSNDGIFKFSSPINYALHTKNTATWMFQSNKSISAKMVRVCDSSFLSLHDSVKYFLLSNGDTILLSKNYGILKFPQPYSIHSYYRIVGVQGVAGVFIPSFKDIYDFHIGDSFEYHLDYMETYPNQEECSFKSGVTNITNSGDTIFVTYKTLRTKKYSYRYRDFLQGKVTYYPDNFLNLYHNEYYIYDASPNKYQHLKALQNLGAPYSNKFAAYSKYFSHINGDQLKIDTLNTELVLRGINGLEDGCDGHQRWIQNLGMVDQEFKNCVFNGPTRLTLLAAKTSKISYGKLSNNSKFSAIESQDGINDIHIYPNPVKDNINILISESSAEVSVNDIMGKQISNFIVTEGENKIDLSGLPNGIYLLNITSSKSKSIIKVIKE